MSTALGFKLLMLHLVLDEVNTVSSNLGLAAIPPVQYRDVRHISLGQDNDPFDLLVVFWTSNCQWGFSKTGLRGVGRVAFEPRDKERLAWLKSLAAQPVPVTPAAAGVLATQWLAAAGVDVGKLQARYVRNLSQPELPTSLDLNTFKPLKPLKVPIYEFRWGGNDFRPPGFEHTYPAAEVHVYGTSGELRVLTVNDPSLLTRRLPRLAGAAEMREVPDAEFAALTNRADFSLNEVPRLFTPEPAHATNLWSQMLQAGESLLEVVQPDMKKNWRPDTINSFYVVPSRWGRAGSMETEQVRLRFFPNGRLRSLTLPTADGQQGVLSREDYRRYAALKSTVSTNEAAALARGWLARLGIDLKTLGEQPTWLHQNHVPGSDSKRPLPWVDVSWGPKNRGVRMRLFTAPARLVWLVVEDASIASPVWLQATQDKL
jgi:hypothetical protein